MLLESSDATDSRVRKEARSLANRGLRLKLISRGDRGVLDTEIVDGFEIKRVSLLTRRIPFRWKWLLPVKIVEFLLRVTLLAIFARARVYHAHHPLMLIPAIVCKVIWRSKVVYDMHELHYSLRPGRIRSKLFTLFERNMLRFTDVLIMSDGQSRAEAFRGHYNFRGPITYLYNFASIPDPLEGISDLRRPLNLPPESKIVIYVGRIFGSRGVEQTLKSMKYWPPNCHFVMMGQLSSVEAGRLRADAEALGVSELVHFFGPVPPDDVQRWLRSADLSVALIQDDWLSYRLSAPTKMFDSVVAGVPQISSDFPEIRRVVLDNPVGPIGTVVNQRDSQEIGDAVNSILGDGGLRSMYAENATRLGVEYYSWEVQEPVLRDIYAELIGTK